MTSFRILALCTLLAAASSSAAHAFVPAVTETGAALTGRVAEQILASPAGRKAIEKVFGAQAASILRGPLASQQAALRAALAREENAALRVKLEEAFRNVPADADPVAIEAAANQFVVEVSNGGAGSLRTAAEAAQSGGATTVSRNALRPRRAQSVPDTGTVLQAKDIPNLEDAIVALEGRGDVPATEVAQLKEAVLSAAQKTGAKDWIGSGFKACISAFTSQRAVGNVVAFISAVRDARSVSEAVGFIDRAIGTRMQENLEAARARRCSITSGSPTGQQCPIIGEAAKLGC